ncbi:9689_t:CDS:2, partial [Funneliformis geosporum]
MENDVLESAFTKTCEVKANDDDLQPKQISEDMPNVGYIYEKLYDETEDYDWNNKIPAALKNLKLDIKKKYVSEVIADVAEKDIYHAG